MKKVVIGLMSAVAILAFAGSASAGKENSQKGNSENAGGLPSCPAGGGGKSQAPECG